MQIQERIFKEAEADNWFRRNEQKLKDFKGDTVTDYLCSLPLGGKKVLEVGCSMGQKIAVVADHGAECCGIDPSSLAIAEGMKRFPKLKLSVGESHSLDFEDESFDLVLINFVFHWVARPFLLRTVSEIDRVLKPGGLVIIGDFYPTEAHKRRYHHTPDLEVYTYKQNYWDIFLTSLVYTEHMRLPFMHDGSEPVIVGDSSAMLIALKKEENYPVRT